MRRRIIAVLIMLLAAAFPAAAAPVTDHEKTLYAIGLIVAKQIEVLELSDKELEMVFIGIADAVKGRKEVVAPEEYQQKIGQLLQARMMLGAEKQKVKSREFLERATREPNAQKTATGLIYVPVLEGSGVQPAETDTVKVHYTGKLVDGKIFDSSVKRGAPAEFKLDSVIKCWTEGVAKMKVGGKAKLICPASIAYGAQGRPPVIPGEAALIFEVELLEVIGVNVRK